MNMLAGAEAKCQELYTCFLWCLVTNGNKIPASTARGEWNSENSVNIVIPANTPNKISYWSLYIFTLV